MVSYQLKEQMRERIKTVNGAIELAKTSGQDKIQYKNQIFMWVAVSTFRARELLELALFCFIDLDRSG